VKVREGRKREELIASISSSREGETNVSLAKAEAKTEIS
jgi:hypothetical protein